MSVPEDDWLAVIVDEPVGVQPSSSLVAPENPPPLSASDATSVLERRVSELQAVTREHLEGQTPDQKDRRDHRKGRGPSKSRVAP